jgi:predicted TIM-barrel fold metal-dependent hydrolase
MKSLLEKQQFIIIGIFMFSVLYFIPLSTLSKDVEDKSILLIDAHNHLLGEFNSQDSPIIDYDSALKNALNKMNKLNIQAMIIMPPPYTINQPFSFNIHYLSEAIKKYPNRFFYLAGGESLNVMIQKAAKNQNFNEKLKEKFTKRALFILKSGAIGFGEIALEHISFNYRHPYESAKPNNPLMLILDDIAAKYNVPIYIHMEALPKDIPLPKNLRSPNNPKILHENIKEFEQLLDHNLNTKIVWVQAGWDHTGYRTVELCRKLLKKHPNLYMTIKVSPKDSLHKNMPMNRDGTVKKEWLELFYEFPDRFMIGTDQFYLPPQLHRHIGPNRVEVEYKFFSHLPYSLARKIGYTNPIRILNLKDRLQ